MYRAAMLERLTTNVLSAGLCALLIVACNDPTKDQAQAKVSAPAASTTAPNAAGVLFAITPDTSKIEWTGSKVTGSHDGSFASFTGTVTVVDGSAEKSRVHIDIDTPSLTTAPDKLVTHLKSVEFFGVEQFPKATFDSTVIKSGGEKGAGYQVTGNLALHGISKSISFPANISISADAVTADATFAINRKDFALNYPGKADDLIRDDVLVKLTVRAHK
jgi:polyisoprenoid-binding protein YceI